MHRSHAIGIALIGFTACAATAQELPDDAARPAAARPTFVPDISAVLTGLLGWFSDVPTLRQPAHEPYSNREGFRIELQELEIAIQSNIDPYLRADLYLAASEEGIEVEELAVSTLGLPARLQVRVGQLLAPFGRVNTQHWLEASPFVDLPLPNRRFFGGENLRGLGAEVSWLAPTPWYVLLVGQVITAQNDVSLGIPVEETKHPRDFAYTAHLRQFFDLSDTWSLTWGLSYTEAPNATGGVEATDDHRTRFAGSDLYLKWRDLTTHAYVALQSEFILRRAIVPGGKTLEGGLTAQIDSRITKLWQVAARFDWFGLPSDLDGSLDFEHDELEAFYTPSEQWRASASVSLTPSEFQRWRVQYNADHVEGKGVVHEAFLQYQIAIGAHGAHSF